MIALASPVSGAPLRADTSHSVSDGAARWPVVDGIPYLRIGRESLVRDALVRLDAGDREGALVLLLADQDDWWNGSAPAAPALRELVQHADVLTLRDAMDLLNYGRVGDYFAHRWSDPTFLAGLGLLQAHWTDPRSAFELACGIGHYLREFERLGVRAVGADVVFSKLWLARQYVTSARTTLVCFDASARWPIVDAHFDLALCQDAFYFLEPKDRILAALRALVDDGGTLLVGHVHNSERANASAGHGLAAETLAALFPDSLYYDDAELTNAVAQARAPVPASADRLRDVDAFAVAPRQQRPPRPACGGIAVPSDGQRLRRNPLYGDAQRAAITWPSDRYASEYGALATYPPTSTAPLQAIATAGNAEAVRRREFVDLPERW